MKFFSKKIKKGSCLFEKSKKSIFRTHLKEVLRSNGIEIAQVFDEKVKSWLGFREIVPIPKNESISYPFFISIGNNKMRKLVSKRIKGTCTTAVHANSIVSNDVSIGDGTCVMMGAIIQTATSIGKHCIINTSASVDHDCVIEDFVHVSPNATLCGNIVVGEGTQVGAGAVIIPGITIGKWAVIGAGAVIVKNVPDGATVVGNPGKVVKVDHLI